MNYFIDCEFLLRTRDVTFLGIKLFRRKNVVQVMSVGIVCDDGREYHAVCSDFNLREAWGRPRERLNVLRPLWRDLPNQEKFSYTGIKRIISKYGKSMKQINEEVKEFINFNGDGVVNLFYTSKEMMRERVPLSYVFESIIYDRIFDVVYTEIYHLLELKAYGMNGVHMTRLMGRTFLDLDYDLEYKLRLIKSLTSFPKYIASITAIERARWSKRLYDFIESL